VFSGRTELLEKLRMTQLLGNATEVEVEFPADYPNSVRHFFLIGFLAQLLTSALFFFMSLRKGHESMPHALAWLAPAIGALAYLAMWAGVAVWYKTSDETPRVIFWARYINHILGTPIILGCIAIFTSAPLPSIITLLGADFLMMSCLCVGAALAGGHKYTWWVAAVLLFIGIVSTFIYRIEKIASEQTKQVFLVLLRILLFCWIAWLVLWLLGSEGTAALGLSQEVGLTCIVDVISVAGLLLYMLVKVDAADDDKPSKQSGATLT